MIRSLVALAALAAAASWTPAKADVSGTCSPIENKTEYLQVRTDFLTSSTSGENVPRTMLNFKATTAGCAIVSFAAESSASGSSPAELILVLDRCTNCFLPDGYIYWLSGGPVGSSETTMVYNTWIIRNLAPGPHTIKVRVKAGIGSSIRMRQRMLTVTY
jgi:hypothetical protein